MHNIAVDDAVIDKLLAEYNSSVAGAQNNWGFDNKRRHVIKSWDDVQACPGSGKTTLVAAKLLLLAQNWKEKHAGICAITHTNVARDEIVAKLQNHSSGFKLASYPHFIGTIQEFINKFLGMPYIRSQYDFKRLVDDDEGKLEIRRVQLEDYTIQQICGNLFYACNRANYDEIKDYLGSLHFFNSDLDLRFFKQNNTPEIVRSNSNSDRRKMLFCLKEALCKAGIFQYRDMYAFASKLLKENHDLTLSLRKRFPVVIVDEMQDTQKFQDDILVQLFEVDDVNMQRFGDPDQAIYDAIGGEEPNVSYNHNNDLYEIETTHRFGNDIGEKIVGLSYNRLEQLESIREPNRGECHHTVIVYRDDTRSKVLDVFGEIVANNSPEKGWKTVKAVGGVEGSAGCIGQYWAGFDKNYSANSPKPKKLIHSINICAKAKPGHISKYYELLVQGVVDLLRKSNIRTTNRNGKQVYYSKLSLIQWLKQNEKYYDFKSLVTNWIMKGQFTQAEWASQVVLLKQLLGINNLNADASCFLEFDEENEANGENNPKSNNVFLCENGQKIEVGTIHSVKGETHDATLILETRFHQNDLQQMLPFLIDKERAKPAGQRQVEFMRKLYVAASRPMHLLCLAIHADHITREQITAMEGLGWVVKNIEEANNA